MNKEKYNQIIDDAYMSYSKKHFKEWETGMDYESKESFIRKCKTDSEFSERWGLLIKETYDLIPHTEDFGDVIITKPKRKNKLIVVYKNEIIEVYD